MKKNFYSIWMRVVLCCFWVMICTFLIIGFTIHFMNRLNIWNLFPLPITGLHFIILLALVALVLGMFISVFIFHLFKVSDQHTKLGSPVANVIGSNNMVT